ncbi:heat-shock protein [Neosynechococcus sphagnicola sy1]|uniref:Endoribonuclease YbeY n=1 Tax=Neosynechococcus sphagnicola sy1 TaxID=1497020 RepID=A0A098TP89_9CYAN|nr:rRNA maturation RNase YbeY [Neosynechococcus sphagnicola]KGF73702.1 heat-shock protein [Neosynechococcus sphagnicola sy1]
MHVELNVQDHWCYENAPVIPVNSWESYFEHWFMTLSPTLSPVQAYEVSLCLTSDAEVQELNRQYRGFDQPTDVLSFAALEADMPQAPELLNSLPLYLGDIMISVETAQRQAQQQGHDLVQELVWLAAHGLLHLLGWDHPDDASLLQMLHQQAILLEIVGFPGIVDVL